MDYKEYYGDVIADYENSNRAYPEEMFQDIIDFAQINENSRLLEIGAGPGTATDGFLKYPIDLLEITEEQTRYLQAKYAKAHRIKAYWTTFEAYDTDVAYDLIYSGTAFHWIDPAIAYPKAAKLLKKDGTLALFWNMTFGVRGGASAYGDLQNIEKRYSLSLSDNSGELLEKRKLEYLSYIYSTGLFTEPICREMRFRRTYHVESYLAWIKSRWAQYGQLDVETQKAFQQEVREYFKDHNGSVEIEQRILLILAKRNDHNPYQFIDVKNMRMAIDLKDLARFSHFPESHFLHCADEVLYVMDDSRLYGIITPGDIIRYHSGGMANKINRNFMAISSTEDREVIEHIFAQFPTVHEIPVIENGRFLGCVKSSKRKTPHDWNGIRRSIREVCRHNIQQGLHMSDLFMALDESEQEKMLGMVFSPSYVKLYRDSYMSE